MVHDGSRRDYQLPPAAPYHNEGKTVAGWVLFWGVCLGALVTGLAFILWEAWLLVVGLVVLAVTIVISIVLAGMGKGQPRRQDPPGPGEADWYA